MLSVFEQAWVLVILQVVNEFEDLTRCGEAVRVGQGSDAQAANWLHNCGVLFGNNSTTAKDLAVKTMTEQMKY